MKAPEWGSCIGLGPCGCQDSPSKLMRLAPVPTGHSLLTQEGVRGTLLSLRRRTLG